MGGRMEKIYEIPQKGKSTKKEREIFWAQVVEDQSTSGMSTKKFCRYYQIPFTAFKYRRYRIKPNVKYLACDNNDGCGKEDQAKFISVELNSKNVTAPINDQEVPIKIFFKNGNCIEIASTKENELSKIISLVSRLSC